MARSGDVPQVGRCRQSAQARTAGPRASGAVFGSADRRRQPGATNVGGSVRNRANLRGLLGIAFFVVGAIIVYVLTNDDDGSSSSPSSPVTVIVAANDIPAGSLADEVIDQGRLKEQKVPANEVVSNAMSSVDALR